MWQVSQSFTTLTWYFPPFIVYTVFDSYPPIKDRSLLSTFLLDTNPPPPSLSTTRPASSSQRVIQSQAA